MHTMRKTTFTQIALMSLFAAVPLCAQRGDPTMTVTGSGKLPDGWMLRFDAPRGTAPAPPMTAISFETMGGGYHVKSGPAAIYYNTKDVGSGQFSVTATFKQSKSMQHEAFGLFIGGSNLQDSTQNYLYFVIKPFDGTVRIARRTQYAARPAPTDIVAENPAAPEAAINRDSPTDGSATNTMLIHVAKDTVHFVINGKVVKAIAKSQLGGSTDGIAGLRINHNMDLHIDGFAVKKQ
jgi:hypothetical protein